MNTLYYGDNLDILRRYVKDESVDLEYLDPPFKSNQDYNVLFSEHDGTRAAAQIKAFEDTWAWDAAAALQYQETVEKGGRLSNALQAMRMYQGETDMLAYLSMMAPRLVELRRVLKPTGSIYLHCDPTASHYLKLIMDAVFGPECFKNEIIWHYRKWSAGKYTFQKNHDVILFYSRTDRKDRTFNQLFMPRAASTLKRFGTAKIVSGHDDSGARVPSQELGESSGARMDDVWDIGRVPPIRQLFPTQKPEPLLERIITASSNPNDVVLDAFCGCGTAIVTAQQLGRSWIGIDITHLAINLIKHRLQDRFHSDVSYTVVGEPVSVADAEDLAGSDPYQFQFWALGLVGARPVEQKKGADKGIDGRLHFHDDGTATTKQVIFSVKAGHNVHSNMVSELSGVLEREKAQIGVLITMVEPTRAMRSNAASGGFYVSPWGEHPRLQILTVAELLDGKKIDMPPAQGVNVTFQKAPKARDVGVGTQGELL